MTGRIVLGLCAAATLFVLPVTNAASQIRDSGYDLLNERVAANTRQFFLYKDADSGFNHGFPSGYFGATQQIWVNPACIDDATASDGCSTDTRRFGQQVLQIKFGPLSAGQSAGLDIEEPMGFVNGHSGTGYPLEPATHIVFSTRSPTGLTLQFGAGGLTTQPVTLAKNSSFTKICIALQGNPAVCPTDYMQLTLNLPATFFKSANLLFTVVISVALAPNGGVVLLKDVEYRPVPARQALVPSMPLSTRTFGVIPVQQAQPGPVSVPPDQVNRDVAALYEASIAAIALCARGTSLDIKNCSRIADAIVYALGHDNAGDPLPVGPDGTHGAHNATSSGDLPLLNSQGSGGGQAGQVRLAGFTASQLGCGAANFCLVLDGATGGNNAFAILALLQAFGKTEKTLYLEAARSIGHWIYGLLRDTSSTGLGGYFAGYPDAGQTKTLETGKSTENNADIYAAFTALAKAEQGRGDPISAAVWTARAKIAGDFVIRMFDPSPSRGCFNAGTVRQGDMDVINTSDFLDANSFSYLAMASSTQYRNRIDWSRVVRCLQRFKSTVRAADQTFSGFDLVPVPTAPPNGVAWEFTGQAALVFRLAGRDPINIINDLRFAKDHAPFGDKHARGECE